LGAYIRAQLSAGQPSIIPKLAAAALGLTEGEAFVLLELLAQGDVLQRVYNVYCRDFGTLLDTVDTPDSLDKISHCDDHDTDTTFLTEGGDSLSAKAQWFRDYGGLMKPTIKKSASADGKPDLALSEQAHKQMMNSWGCREIDKPSYHSVRFEKSQKLRVNIREVRT